LSHSCSGHQGTGEVSGDSNDGMNILLGTSNKGKLEELQRIASRYGVTLRGLSTLSSQRGSPPHVGEGGISYEENSRVKAAAYAEWAGEPVITDDTGIEFSDLYGFPGVYTADVGLIRVVATLGCIREARARFVTVVTYAEPSGRMVSARGELNGVFRLPLESAEEVVKQPLPFAPFFFPLGERDSLRELTSHTSPRSGFLGHRGIAFRNLLTALR
jgi:XTP/dITP diphosphohydrolase